MPRSTCPPRHPARERAAHAFGHGLALRIRAAVLAATCALVAGAPSPLAGQDACPQASGPDAEAGWAAYRAGDLDGARRRFQAATARCPDDAYARTGLGYVALRDGDAAEARRLFRSVTAAEPANVDALVGLGLLAWRQGDLEEVRARFLDVAAVVPDHPTAFEYLARLPEGLGPPPDRAPLVLPDTLQVPARTRGDRFEVRTPEGWVPFYVEGMNLGAALPGRNPSEFPDSATYAAWIEGMAGMNANVVRVYTIHPPRFYQALWRWNTDHPDRPLRLVHGVWTELPEDGNYLDPAFEAEFFGEMERVVDVLHGRADLRPRPGHAAGFYTADVSPWTLAYIIGREWEPFSSMAFDSIAPGFRSWEGEYVRLADGVPMEAWLAKAVDRITAYETRTYRAQRPVAYTNWPTLDPMEHPTEATRAEEVAIRRALDEAIDFEPREYDNDVLGLDATRMEATPAFQAGLFASFHAYPYYPDFMVLQPSYGQAASSFGPSRYFGYLRDLKAAHPGMPVIVAEYGVPASHGTAHLQPDGQHHGGLTEEQMAAIDRRLTVELAEAGMAGGIVFAWIDEWFKKNWLAIEFERPADRNRLWYNRLDAEQNYGMLAMEAEPAVAGATLAQRRAAWTGVPALYRGDQGVVRAAADAAHLWLYVEAPGMAAGDRLMVGLDVVDPGAGDRRWPGAAGGPAVPVGLEFVVVHEGDEVRVVADPPVNPFRLVPEGADTRAAPGAQPPVVGAPPGFFRGRVGQRFNPPYTSTANADGRYDSLLVVSNRRRVGRDSLEYLAMGYDRGVLPAGAPPDGMWERDGNALEVRIPWLLINVTDPSSRSVLASMGSQGAGFGRTAEGLVVLPGGQVVPPDTLIGDLGTVTVEDIGVVAALRDADGGWTTWPAGGEAARFTWPGWDEEGVRWRARARPVYDVLRDTWAELDPYAGADPTPAQEAPLAAADSAWTAGDVERAGRLYEAVLEGARDHPVALHRLALMAAWEERYEPSLVLFDRLLAAHPDHLDGRVDRARVLAWSGRPDEAVSALDRVLDEHPGHAPALEARASFQAWAGRYDDALSSYDALMAAAPDPRAVRRQQAQVLSWASRYEASRALYDSLLVADPSDVDARLGRARVLTFAGDLAEAEREYERVLRDRPDHVAALQGLGRARSWGGRLVAGEASFRRAVAVEPDDVASLVGLAQNLRWQGRNAAALEVLERARALDPADGDVREQLRWIDVALAPQLRPTFVVEDDSDDNHMVSSSVAAQWHVLPRLGLRADAYRRALSHNELERSAWGVTVSASWQFEPGWTVSAGTGGSRTDGTGTSRFTNWLASVATPGRYPAAVTLEASSSALDATAALAERGVEVRSVGASGRWTPAPAWRVTAAAGRATFEGSSANRRLHGALGVSRRVGRIWTVGVGGRAFGFEEDLADGYFDPDLYAIGEATVRWTWEPAGWSFQVEAAPGLQQVRSDGDPAGAFRASARAAWRLAPGRELAVSAGYSSAGLQSFSTGDSDYRYTALVLSASWVF